MGSIENMEVKNIALFPWGDGSIKISSNRNGYIFIDACDMCNLLGVNSEYSLINKIKIVPEFYQERFSNLANYLNKETDLLCFSEHGFSKLIDELRSEIPDNYKVAITKTMSNLNKLLPKTVSDSNKKQPWPKIYKKPCEDAKISSKQNVDWFLYEIKKMISFEGKIGLVDEYQGYAIAFLLIAKMGFDRMELKKELLERDLLVKVNQKVSPFDGYTYRSRDKRLFKFDPEIVDEERPSFHILTKDFLKSLDL